MHYTHSSHHVNQFTFNTRKYSVLILAHSLRTQSLAHSSLVRPFPYSSWRDLGSVFLALRQLQAERPSYRAGVERWWREVVSRTAVGAGADPQAVQRHLGTIVPSLMKRFSSREGYRLFDDSLPTRASSKALLPTPQLIHSTVRTLREMGVRTGLITNSDARIGGLLCCMDDCTLKAG